MADEFEIPPFEVRPKCPKCGHVLCGSCGQTFHHETIESEPGYYTVTDGEFCCKCDHRFQLRGVRYGRRG